MARKVLNDIAIDLYDNPSTLSARDFIDVKQESDISTRLHLVIPKLTQSLQELYSLLSPNLLEQYQFPLLDVLDLSDVFFQSVGSLDATYRYSFSEQASRTLSRLIFLYEQTNNPLREKAMELHDKYAALALAQNLDQEIYNRLDKARSHLLHSAIKIEQSSTSTSHFKQSLSPHFKAVIDEAPPGDDDESKSLQERYTLHIEAVKDILKAEAERIRRNHMIRMLVIDPDTPLCKQVLVHAENLLSEEFQKDFQSQTDLPHIV